MALGIHKDIAKIYGSALSNATRNDILDTVGMQQYMSEDEKEKRKREEEMRMQGMKKGGKVKASSASKRADGCAIKGKTRGKMV
jgi:hypothetical protein